MDMMIGIFIGISLCIIFLGPFVLDYIVIKREYREKSESNNMSFEQFMQLKDFNTLLELWATAMARKFALDIGLLEGGFDYPRYLKLYEKINEVDYLARVEIEIKRHEDNTMLFKYYDIKRYYDEYNSIVEDLNESFRDNNIIDYPEMQSGLIWCYKKLTKEISGLQDHNIGLMDRLGES